VGEARYVPILRQIRSRSIYQDEFGDEVRSRWDSALAKFICEKMGFDESDGLATVAPVVEWVLEQLWSSSLPPTVDLCVNSLAQYA
jgi:hypothetical protein